MAATEFHVPLLALFMGTLWLSSLAFVVWHYRSVLDRERKLKESMSQLLNFTDLCTYMFDMRRDAMHLSPACAKLLGLPKEIEDFTAACQQEDSERSSYRTLLQAITPEADQQRLQFYRANGSVGTYRVTNRIYYTKHEEIDYILGLLTDITDEAHREERLAIHAQIDGLTHVYNSGTVRRMLSESIVDLDETSQGAFLILDIDNFKKFNDLYGHQTGDQVLRIVSRLLREQLRVDDVIGRLGGDEFCAYLPGLPSLGYLSSLCERLNSGVTAAAREEGIPAPVTISIGATLLHTFDDFLTAYDRADRALYEAKAKGRNGYVVKEYSSGKEEDISAENSPAEDN